MTNLRTTIAALFVGASSIAIALPATAQDAGVSTDLSVTGEAGNNAQSGSAGADTGLSVDENGVTASISGDTDADVDTTLGNIAANAEGSADVEADVMAQIEGMSDDDKERLNERCDAIVNGDEMDVKTVEVCNVILNHNG